MPMRSEADAHTVRSQVAQGLSHDVAALAAGEVTIGMASRQDTTDDLVELVHADLHASATRPLVLDVAIHVEALRDIQLSPLKCQPLERRHPCAVAGMRLGLDAVLDGFGSAEPWHGTPFSVSLKTEARPAGGAPGDGAPPLSRIAPQR
jgi:hypothetical protein